MASTTRVYLTPKVGTGEATSPFRPKSFVDETGLSWITGPLACQNYGGEPSFLVTAEMTPAEHSRASRMPGVGLVTPYENLDASVNDYDQVLWGLLEDHGFPALWIEPETTYRVVLRHLQRCIHLAQRMAYGTRLFPNGLTLDTHLLSVPPAQRQYLIDAVVAGGGTASGLHETMTLRTAIRLLADQLPTPTTLLNVPL